MGKGGYTYNIQMGKLPIAAKFKRFKFTHTHTLGKDIFKRENAFSVNPTCTGGGRGRGGEGGRGKGIPIH